jgi:transposase-like protein
MRLQLHANATTTPKTRAYIQTSILSVAELARELGVSETTVRRWRARDATQDRSHARHNLGQSTTPEQEGIIAALRRDAGLSLDDITEVMQRCLAPDLSRSAIWRCLVRQGLNRSPAAAAADKGALFEAAPFGYVHVDLKYLGKLQSVPEFAFVAIERTTRFAHVEILPDRGRATVAAAMQRFLDAFGHKVHTVLTDNGAEFTDRFAKGTKAGHDARPSGRHPFDALCAAHGITHRLTRPYTPRTNGMVERFNRRLAEAIRALPHARDNSRHARFFSNTERTAFLLRFVHDYNRTRLRCLSYNAPLEVLNNLTKDNTGGRSGAARRRKCALIPGKRRKAVDDRQGRRLAILAEPITAGHRSVDSGTRPTDRAMWRVFWS